MEYKNDEARLRAQGHFPEEIFASVSDWIRDVFVSIYHSEYCHLIVLKDAGSDEWRWTARGAIQPDEGDGADSFGWMDGGTREEAEQTAFNWLRSKL